MFIYVFFFKFLLSLEIQLSDEVRIILIG